MSNIFNILVNARSEEFNKVNPTGAGKSDIKPGQVVIARLLPKQVGINGEVMECSANWKPSNNSVFYKGQRFKMTVDVLYSKHSKGEKTIPVTELPGKLLYIRKPGTTYELINQKSVGRYSVQWMILGKKPEVVSPENADMHLLFANAKTLGQASDNLTNSAKDSLFAAYDLEAKYGSSRVDGMNYGNDDNYNDNSNLDDPEDACPLIPA